MREKISVEHVKAEVQRFWSTFSTKDSQSMMHFYAAGATVFNSSSSRQELGPVNAARRGREYFQSGTIIRFRLGDIRVELLGEHCDSAIASYVFQFHATNVVTASGATEENIQLGRATQIFARDQFGSLRIMHEHLSMPAWPSAGLEMSTAYLPEHPGFHRADSTEHRT
ncbi:MAG TPA: nuclear transport factor 2 family protein [Verrucomicrobiae bacterium]|jgi:ketosteroid isomerase-like protein|nr:nuclear transport factor 2 family protein [Verrucomicrobiae bacterium]